MGFAKSLRASFAFFAKDGAKAIMRGMKNTSYILVCILMLGSALAQTAKPKPSGANFGNVYAIQDGFVDAHGVLIYYQIVGHGAPLMIFHGDPGASHDYFLSYLMTMARPH